MTTSIFVPVTCDEHYVYVSGTRQNADGSFNVIELFCEDCGHAYGNALDEEFAELTDAELFTLMGIPEEEWAE